MIDKSMLTEKISRAARSCIQAVWHIVPGSTMTNANVDAIVSTNNGKVLTLGYKGGSQKIIVPRDAPVVSLQPADKSVLKWGRKFSVLCSKLPTAV
jgi:hypothetical protein